MKFTILKGIFRIPRGVVLKSLTIPMPIHSTYEKRLLNFLYNTYT